MEVDKVEIGCISLTVTLCSHVNTEKYYCTIFMKCVVVDFALAVTIAIHYNTM